MKTQLTIEKAEEIFNEVVDKIKDSKLKEFLKIHVPSVKNTCTILSSDKDLNKEVLIIASWIHDIGYSINEEKHPEESLRLLEKVYGFEIRDKLKDCILNHGTRGIPKTKEGRLFQIADKISIFDEDILTFFVKNITNKEDFDYFKSLISSANTFLNYLGEI